MTADERRPREHEHVNNPPLQTYIYDIGSKLVWLAPSNSPRLITIPVPESPLSRDLAPAPMWLRWESGRQWEDPGREAGPGRGCNTREKAQFLKLPLLNVISYFLKFWQDWNGKINGLQSRLKITFTTLLQHKTQKSLFMEILRRKDSDLKAKTEYFQSNYFIHAGKWKAK